MPSITDTIARMRTLRMAVPSPNGGDAGSGGLVPLDRFGRNPGELRALLHVPADLRSGAALVVILHGCTQTAAAYDRGSGWSALADRFGFAVLYPEQQRANNPNLCFNWFVPGDTRRGGGEAESIREMIAAAVRGQDLDRARVFVNGLSAGGAMTSVMLATCPELFAGGAIIAGLPYGTASGVPEALARMRGEGHDRARLSERVLAASSHRGPWPTVSVWHGLADPTVDAVNAAMIVDQWRGVHGVGEAAVVERAEGHIRRVWRDAAGRAVIEDHALRALSHGTPITTAGDEALGIPGPYMLEAGISSTYRIAASWGIVPAVAPALAPAVEPSLAGGRSGGSGAGSRLDPARTINDALRAAGLLRS